jgi:serine/threonine protein kinase/formylglycine-generating enzyme required for sulfatase activity
MSPTQESEGENSLTQAQLIDKACDRFELAWIAGNPISIQQILDEFPLQLRDSLANELVVLELEMRRNAGQSPSLEEYARYLPVHQSGEETEKATNKRISYFGDYELLGRIARGGMGTVYRARQVSLNRMVAIKMINSGQFASTEEIARFYSEAKAAAGLDHPNIVPVFEVGEFEGNHFYSMAFVDGQSLAEKLNAGPMESQYVARLIQSIAMAVQYAHDRGVIHRDLKPSNVLLDSLERPRITDFGLAKQLTDSQGLTLSGDILGTPSFMAPEQAAGKFNAVSYPSDIYSIGAILYMCLSGRPPFQAASQAATLKQVMELEPVALRQLNPAIPRDMETIAHKCLEKSISRRYSSPASLAQDLERYLTGQPILARPVSLVEKSVRWCQRNPSKALNLAGAILLAIGMFAGWLFLRVRDHDMALRNQADSIVSQINVSDEAELHRIIQQARSLPRAMALLQQQFANSAERSSERFRAALALLPRDPNSIDLVREVCESWLDATWMNWSLLRNQLSPSLPAVTQWVQSVDLDRVSGLTELQFTRWIGIKVFLLSNTEGVRMELSATDAERMVNTLTRELLRDPSQLRDACGALKFVRNDLAPFLEEKLDFTRKDAVVDASIAAQMISEFYKDSIKDISEIGAKSRAEWIPILLGSSLEPARLRDEMRRIFVLPIHSENWDQRIINCRRRAMAGTTLAQIGDFEAMWLLFDMSQDTSVRSLAIEWLPMMLTDPTSIIRKINELVQDRQRTLEQVNQSANVALMKPNPWLTHPESSLLRVTLNILGNYPPRELSRRLNDTFWASISERLEFDPDPGVHASCEWLLRRANRTEALDALNERLSNQRAKRLGWHFSSNGHLMAVIRGPLQFTAGGAVEDPYRDAGESYDPIDQRKNNWVDDKPHPKRIDRSFAIALHETTLAQVHQFDSDFHKLHNAALGPTQKHPACRVSWNLAASYCNWLTEQEGLGADQMCFVKSDKGDLQPAPNYLHRRGFRLPTEAEWEYACRAGTTTRHYLGDLDELLPNNVWYIENAREKLLVVPGTHKGNALGLFDTLGNVKEWCMDSYSSDNSETRFRERDDEQTLSFSDRIIRGGSIYTNTNDIRVSEYSNFKPSYREGNTGFRIAKTIAD